MLADGSYVIGRSPTCDIVLDVPGVSRQHAHLEVKGETVRIVDAGSRNGVYVNGVRVRDTRSLSDGLVCAGDVIGLGGEELELQVGGATLSSRPGLEDVDEDTVTIRFRDSQPSDLDEDSRVTLVVDELDVIAQSAEQALEAGRTTEAENLLEARLVRVLNDSVRRVEVSPGTVKIAVALGCRLARATGRGFWFDYVIDLLNSQRIVCSERQVEELRAALAEVSGADPRRLVRYASTLRSQKPTMETIRAARGIDELSLAASRPKRR